jgi:adenylate cyclase class IV
MDDFKELEYKYDANDISLSSFLDCISKMSPVKRVDVSSWDYYYTPTDLTIKDEFIRFRQADSPELTIKRKTKNSNNWERVEVDLPLDSQRLSKTSVDAFTSLLNYQENTKIYKTCFIYWFENVNVVYYIVYDKDMKERSRFIEIEVNKEKVKDLADPFVQLKELETKLGELGIKSNNRLKRSLFEIFVKG